MLSSRRDLCLTGVALAALLLSSASVAQDAKPTRHALTVDDPRPMSKAIEELEKRHGWVITYEDPVYVHASEILDVTRKVRRDLDQYPEGKAPKVLIPKGGKIALRYMASAKATPQDVVSILDGLRKAHVNRANPGRFRIDQSGKVVHVIGTAARNAAGEVAARRPLLDLPVTLPRVERNGVQMLEAICAQLEKATGTKVVVGTVPLSLMMRHKSSQAAHGETARDALMSFLSGMGIKLSWQLYHDPGLNWYVLNIHGVLR